MSASIVVDVPGRKVAMRGTVERGFLKVVVFDVTGASPELPLCTIDVGALGPLHHLLGKLIAQRGGK